MTQPAVIQLRALPVADRLRLIEDLWDSIASEAIPLPAWHCHEIDRRLDALDSASSVGAPWAEARARISGKR